MSTDIKPTNNWRKYIKDLKGQQHYLIFVFDLNIINICCWEHQIGFCSHATVFSTKDEWNQQTMMSTLIPIDAKTLWWLRIHCFNVVSSICISSRVQFPYTFSYHPFVDNLQMQALYFHHIIGNKSNAYLYILVHFPWIHVCKCNCRNL